MQKREKAERKNNPDDGINYKKIFFELMAVLTVLFIVVLVILYPIFVEKGVISTDKYASYREIIEEVDQYDYSKGRNLELEEKLDKGYEKTVSYTKAYFYALASGIYYCNIGYYNTAIEAFNWLDQNKVVKDKTEILKTDERRVLCERKMSSEGWQ